MTSPTPTARDIRARRIALGLTQAQASAMVHSTARAWRYWERGKNIMPQALWELFELKAAEAEASA